MERDVPERGLAELAQGAVAFRLAFHDGYAMVFVDGGKPMVLRTVQKGQHAGRQFWGCSAYPDCKGVVEN
jgi:hypothetical protein